MVSSMKNSAILLKRTKIQSGDKFDYILIGCREKEMETIGQSRELTKRLKTILESSNYKEDSIDVVLYLGNLKEFKQSSLVVYKFPQRERDIKEGKAPYFRDYCKSVEKQKESMWLVNTAPDYKVSWNTAIKACDSKFGIILKIKL